MNQKQNWLIWKNLNFLLTFSTTIIFSKKDTEIIKRYFLGNKKYHETETELADLKTYEIIKYACKGVATRYAHEFIIKGMALIEKPIRLKEGLIRVHAVSNEDKNSEFLKDIGANVWREVQKESHSIHIKRKGEKGITWPQDARDLKDLIKNSYSEDPISIEAELKSDNININKPVYENYFSSENNIKPDNWDEQKTAPPARIPFNAAKKNWLSFLFNGKKSKTWHYLVCRAFITVS